MEPRSNVIEVDIQKEMQKSFLDYSMSVIVSRALPDVRDGLKPVHRRILYSQYEDGLTPDKAYKKVRHHRRQRAGPLPSSRRCVRLRRPGPSGPGFLHALSPGGRPWKFRFRGRRPAGRLPLYGSQNEQNLHEMLTDIDKDTVNLFPTTTTAARSRRFCHPGFQTCWSMAPLASPWAWPPTFLPIIWGKPSTRFAT